MQKGSTADSDRQLLKLLMRGTPSFTTLFDWLCGVLP